MILISRSSSEKLSDNFRANEFACKCCDYTIIDTNLINLLEKLRFHVGKPLKITSGYRCPKHNASVGGAALSRHVAGLAADVRWDGFEFDIKTEQTKKMIRDLAQVSQLYGIGWADSFVHLDVDVSRKILTEWKY